MQQFYPQPYLQEDCGDTSSGHTLAQPEARKDITAPLQVKLLVNKHLRPAPGGKTTSKSSLNFSQFFIQNKLDKFLFQTSHCPPVSLASVLLQAKL